MINECVKNTIICEFFLLFIKKKCVLTCDVCKNLDLMYTFSNLIILQFNLKKYNKNTKLFFFLRKKTIHCDH